MKEKIFTYLGIIMIFFIMIIRTFYYIKMEGIIIERDNTTKINKAKILYEEIASKGDLIIQEGNNFDASILYSETGQLSRENVLQVLMAYKQNMHSIKNVFMVTNNGQYYSTSTNRENASNVLTEEWYLKTARRLSPCLTAKENSDGTKACIASFPIIYNNQYAGVIGYEVDGEYIKILIDYNLNEFKQLYLLDESDNVIYQYVNRYTAKKDDVIHYVTDSDITTNNNRVLNFTIKVIYDKNEPLKIFAIYKYIMGLLIGLILVLGIIKLLRTKNKTLIIRFSFEIIIVFALEAYFLISYMVRVYDSNVAKHIPVIDAYRESTLLTYDLLSDSLYKNLNDKIQKTNELNIFENDEVKKYATKGKNTLGNVINYFYVDDKGVYSCYPSFINDELEKENFDSFRELFNNASINDYRVVKAKDDYLLYTRLYKIRKNSELVGILGINIKLGTLANDINKIFGDGEARKVFEVRENGNLYSKYYNELYENINNKYYKDNLIYKFKDDKTALVLGEKSGAVKEAKKLDAVRYLHFRDMDKTKIDFVRIDVEREGITKGEITAFIVLFILSFIMYIILLQVFGAGNKSQYADLEKEITESIEKKYNVTPETTLQQRLQIFDKTEKNDEVQEENIKEKNNKKNKYFLISKIKKLKNNKEK